MTKSSRTINVSHLFNDYSPHKTFTEVFQTIFLPKKNHLLNGLFANPSNQSPLIKEDKPSYTPHDLMFKKTIQSFFKQFIEVFYPEFYKEIEFSLVKFISEEVITHAIKAYQHQVDMLFEATWKSTNSLIIIHIESQSYAQRYFNERMFHYYCVLYDKYRRDPKLKRLCKSVLKRKLYKSMNIPEDQFGIFGRAAEISVTYSQTVARAQLREFTALNPINGKFHTVPEYPEFAWLEGIVNAVTHRAYHIQGDDIKIKMFDDRLEISSPGTFPNVVNQHNLREIRYSRNPRIARALTEIGWVRELGEGVKRMFKEMNDFFLDDPEYQENGNSVRLILKNNIVMRRIRRQERITNLISIEWDTLGEEARTALEYIYNRGKITTSQLSKLIGRSNNYSRNILDNLSKREIIALKRTSVNDPNQHYVFKNDE